MADVQDAPQCPAVLVWGGLSGAQNLLWPPHLFDCCNDSQLWAKAGRIFNVLFPFKKHKDESWDRRTPEPRLRLSATSLTGARQESSRGLLPAKLFRSSSSFCFPNPSQNMPPPLSATTSSSFPYLNVQKHQLMAHVLAHSSPRSLFPSNGTCEAFCLAVVEGRLLFEVNLSYMLSKTQRKLL